MDRALWVLLGAPRSLPAPALARIAAVVRSAGSVLCSWLGESTYGPGPHARRVSRGWEAGTEGGTRRGGGGGTSRRGPRGRHAGGPTTSEQSPLRSENVRRFSPPLAPSPSYDHPPPEAAPQLGWRR